MDEKRAKELFADKEFVKSLLALETPEQVQAAAKAKGLDLTLDEISAIKGSLTKTNGELSEADLEKVAGGTEFLTPIIEIVQIVPNIITDIVRSRW